jgi:hypothetical protein
MTPTNHPTLSTAEQYARDGAFLGLVPPPSLGLPDRLLSSAGLPFGPALGKLTPWRHHLLLGYDSPYITGADCRRRHLWQALYLCSPAFRPGSRVAFLAFQARTFWFVARHFQAASAALCAWLSAPFSFMPAMPVEKADAQGRPEASRHWLISLMQLGRMAGFQPMEVIHVPYAILWPSLDSVMAGKVKDRPKFNRALDKARGEYLRNKNRLRAQSARN